MAPLLHRKIFLAILSKLRFSTDYTKRCLGRLALLLVFLGRKFSQWWHSRPGKPASSQTLKPDPLFRTGGTEANSGPVFVKQYTVAASSVPASASHPSLHERVEGQPATADTRTPVELSHGHNSPYPLGGSGLVNRSVGNLSIASIQSRASDRLSIITSSRDSLRATTHGQPSLLPSAAHIWSGRDNRRSASMDSTQSRASDRLSFITTSHDSIRATHGQPSRPQIRAVHRQFGRGPDPSRSREPTRPNTPLSPHTPDDPPRLEIITTNLPSPTHENGRVSPVVPPLLSPAYTHEPLSPPPMNEIRRRPSSAIIVDVQNPSTESLPISPSITNLPMTEEPISYDEQVPSSPTSSDAETLDYYFPEGRFVQLINSDQIPRYTKNTLMQVEYTTLSPHPYISLQTSRGNTL